MKNINHSKNIKINLYIRYSYYFIQFFSGFFLIPFYLNNFSIKLYGVWILISSICGFLMLMDPSSSHLIVQQISEKIKKFGYRKVNKIILPSILNAILISFLIILVGNYFLFPILISIINTEFYNNEISLIMKFVIANISLMILISTITGFFEGLQKSKSFGSVILLGLILKIIIVIFLIEKNYGIKSIAISEFITNTIVLLYLIILFLFKYKNLLFNHKIHFTDYSKFSKKYIHNYGGRFSKIFIMGGLDSILISKFVGLDMVTVLNLAQKIPLQIQALIGLFFTSSRSSIAYLLSGKKSIYNDKLIVNLVNTIIIITIFLFFLLFDVLNPFLRIWISQNIFLNELLIILIILIMILRIYISSIQSLLFSKGNIKFVNNIQIAHSIILVPLIITFSFIYNLEGLLMTYFIINLIFVAPICTNKIFQTLKNKNINLIKEYRDCMKIILGLTITIITYKYLFEQMSINIDTWVSLFFICIIKVSIFILFLIFIKKDVRIFLLNKFFINKRKYK